MSKNRFAGLQAVKKIQDNNSAKVIDAPKINNVKRSISKVNAINDDSNTIVTQRRGRPNGKRSNSDFQQVTAYIRRDTYRRVSVKLIDQEIKGEFSELIEELLQQWLEK